MKTTLVDLWNGKIEPWSARSMRFDEISRLFQFVERHTDSLNERLDEEGKALLEKLQNCYDELEFMQREDAFIKGFCLGAKLVAEAMVGE